MHINLFSISISKMLFHGSWMAQVSNTKSCSSIMAMSNRTCHFSQTLKTPASCFLVATKPRKKWLAALKSPIKQRARSDFQPTAAANETSTDVDVEVILQEMDGIKKKNNAAKKTEGFSR